MPLLHPQTLDAATGHRERPVRRQLAAVAFAALYAVAMQSAYRTAGEPYRVAVEQRAALDALEQAKANATPAEGGGGAVAAAEALRFGDAPEVPAAEAEGPPSAAFNASGNETDTATLLKAERPLPAEWLPNAWVCVGIFLLAVSHALFYLMCHWSVDFKVRVFFSPCDELREGCHVRFRPMPHKGKPSLVRLGRSRRTGRLVCEFQRQQYEVLDAAAARAADGGAELAGDARAAQAVRLVSPPVALPLSYYAAEATGLRGEEEVQARAESFGPNIIAVRTPSFLELYVQQLLSPLAIFQVFTSLLWLLDAVSLGFTAFQVASILLLESTTVFQRQRMLKMLNAMSAKPYTLHAYRSGAWRQLPTTALLPGDLVSLRPPARRPDVPRPALRAPAGGAPTVSEPGAPPPPAPESPNDAVPCDCVLVRGSAVVNEASLTGESVPQMKDSLPHGQGRPLDMNGEDRVHTLFAGTTIMSASPGGGGSGGGGGGGGGGEPLGAPGVPPTPDGGCLCVVLRTGFSSSQGELMQMIEFSQQQVSDDSRETLYALALLLLFALASSAYVLKKGMERNDRTTHELLLKCVIIITSVVPRHLPMQTAMAVNAALMALMKKGIFCTEPYRVPFAGKVDSVLFDKTGTLTSDKLVPVGVLCAPDKAGAPPPPRVEVREASADACVVLAGCHALVSVADVPELVGDPIELAALEGVGWSYAHAKQTATPGDTGLLERAIALKRQRLREEDAAAEAAKAAPPPAALGAPPPPPSAAKREAAEAELRAAEAKVVQLRADASRSEVASVQILARHHFSSALQRMSTVALVRWRDGRSEARCLVKGSPEALQPLLAPGAAPGWYEQSHRALSEKGMRVLALAYKRADEGAAAWSREQVEGGLQFAGFIAFACKTRSDSGMVVSALLQSAHAVSMLTGDAPLTALHVAREVGICAPDRPELLLAQDESGGVHWVRALGAERAPVAPFSAEGVRGLAAEYELMATDGAIDAALSAHGEGLLGCLDCFKVFARMSPQGKARVIRALQERNGRRVLMCGDGGNDVGALKQADVGLALLSGFTDQNTSADAPPAAPAGAEGGILVAASKKAEELLNSQTLELAKKAASAAALTRTALAAKQRELQGQQAVWLQQALAAREAAGLPMGVMGHVTAVREAAARMRAELEVERRRLAAIHGNVFDAQRDALSKMTAEMGADDPMMLVKPGDASVAAPFTCRSPSVRNIVDLIRQGRCTLLSALQQQQIMMLESLVSAYVLSALSLEGARSSERQMIASSWLLMTASIAFSYATPVEKMHPERPLRNLFHPAIFVSMAGQALIHLLCMRAAVNMATAAMGPAKLSEVVEFHRRERLRELKEANQAKAAEEGDWMASSMAIWSTPFLPNLLNTCVFLVETSQCVAILLVNYKGRPWMKGITENHPLFLSLLATVLGCGVLSWSLFPELNALIHLEPFPDDAFRLKVMWLVLVSLGGTFVWDRLCIYWFAPSVFQALKEEAAALSLADMLPAAQTLAKVVIVLGVLGSGNLVVIGICYYMYRQMK